MIHQQETQVQLPVEEAAVEVCSLLHGAFGARFWAALAEPLSSGTVDSVTFDPVYVQDQEVHGGMIGFHHTHPTFPAFPSDRDVRTMRAWVASAGHPLLCLITGTDGLRAWLFSDDDSSGEEVPVERVAGRYVGSLDGGWGNVPEELVAQQAAEALWEEDEVA